MATKHTTPPKQPSAKPAPTVPAKLPVRRRYQVFRKGTHTDTSGRTMTYTDAHLDTLVASYDRKRHFAPLCQSHPEDDSDTSLGGVECLSREGDALYADVLMSKEVAEQIDGFQWLGLSVALYGEDNPHNPTPGKLSLRHLGLCGKEPPAIKGMAPLQTFSEGDTTAGSLEYTELPWAVVAYPFEAIARLLRGLRENMIAEKGIDATDNVLPNWQIDQVESAARQLQEASNSTATPFFSETTPKDTTMTPEEIAALQAENATLKQVNATLLAQDQAKTVAALHNAHLAFCEQQISTKKMLPKDKDMHVNMLDFLATQDPKTDTQWLAKTGGTYAEGVTPSRYDDYKKNLAAAPVVVPPGMFSERALPGNAGAASAEKSPLQLDAERRAAKA